MRILIADDDTNFVQLLTLMIQDAGHEVAGIVTTGGPDVIGAYDNCAPDAVLIDFIMPHYNGIIAARQILTKQPNARVAIVSGLPDTDKLRKVAKDAGALAVLKKPFSQSQLNDFLSTLQFTRRLVRSEVKATHSVDSRPPSPHEEFTCSPN